jgi:hypothetical protein
MVKAFIEFVLAVVMVVCVGLLYLYFTTPFPTGNLTDANLSPTCAEFQQKYDDTKGAYTLSYADRIRQLFYGCY